MFQLTQLRLVGYASIISMHIINIFYMRWHRTHVHEQDERALMFKNMEYRFLTTWTFLLQIAYVFGSLACDVNILKNASKQSYTLPRFITEFRDTIFAAIIWPTSWAVSTIFWGLYIYDRSLIFPEYLDPFLPKVSNHIIHTAIVPIVLFEVMSRPRVEPSSHLKNLAITTLYIGSYLLVMLITYKQSNVWLYPIFGKLFGSVYFVLLVAIIYGLFIVFYFIQWPIGNMIFMQGVKKSRQIQKRKKRV